MQIEGYVLNVILRCTERRLDGHQMQIIEGQDKGS